MTSIIPPPDDDAAGIDFEQLASTGAEFTCEFEFDIHEASSVFPSVKVEEERQFRESLREQGQLQPIILYSERVSDDPSAWSIVDGKNRYRILKELGVAPRFKLLTDLEGLSLEQFAALANLDRRHLNESQRALFVLRYEPEIAAEAQKRMKVGKQPSGNVARGSTSLILSRKASVSEGTLKKAQRLRSSQHEVLVRAVFDGWLKLETAMRLLNSKLSAREIQELCQGEPADCRKRIQKTLAPKKKKACKQKISVTTKVRKRYPSAVALLKQVNGLENIRDQLADFERSFAGLPVPDQADCVTENIASAIEVLSSICPVATCDVCDGFESNACRNCNGRGWLSVTQLRSQTTGTRQKGGGV